MGRPPTVTPTSSNSRMGVGMGSGPCAHEQYSGDWYTAYVNTRRPTHRPGSHHRECVLRRRRVLPHAPPTAHASNVRPRPGQWTARSAVRAMRRLSFHLSGAQLGISLVSLLLGFPGQARHRGADRLRRAPRPQRFDGPNRGRPPPGHRVPDGGRRADPQEHRHHPPRGDGQGPVARRRRCPRRVGPDHPPVQRVGQLAHPQDGHGAQGGDGGPTARWRSWSTSSARRAIRVPSTPTPTNCSPSTLRFGDKTAADALTPRVHLRALPLAATVEELTEEVAESNHSRYPVYDGELDNIQGVVTLGAIFETPAHRRAEVTMAEIMKQPPGRARNQGPGRHPRRLPGRPVPPPPVVMDEHGGTAGILTLEDGAGGDGGRGRRRARHGPDADRGRGRRGLPAGRHPPPRRGWPSRAGWPFPRATTRPWPGFVLHELGQDPGGRQPGGPPGVDDRGGRDGQAPDRLAPGHRSSVGRDLGPVSGVGPVNPGGQLMGRLVPIGVGAAIYATVPGLLAAETEEALSGSILGWFFAAAALMIALNAACVAYEFALLAAKRSTFLAPAVAERRSSMAALASMSDLSHQLAGAQLGITMTSLVLGYVGEPAFEVVISGILGSRFLPRRDPRHRHRGIALDRAVPPPGAGGDGAQEHRPGRARRHPAGPWCSRTGPSCGCSGRSSASSTVWPTPGAAWSGWNPGMSWWPCTRPRNWPPSSAAPATRGASRMRTPIC